MTDQPSTTDSDPDIEAAPDPFADMDADELRDIARTLDAELAGELQAHEQTRAEHAATIAARDRAEENLKISRSESEATKTDLSAEQELRWKDQRHKRFAVGAAVLMAVITALALTAVVILAIKLP